MNTDIRISVSFKGHRKRKKFRMLLGDPGATDYLIDFWISVAMDRPDGNLGGLDDMDIALMAGWEGDPGKFISAMLDAGFLDRIESGFVVHGWTEHNGYASAANVRSEAARKAALAKWGKRGQCAGNADAEKPQCGSSCGGNAPSPSPIPSPSPTPSQKEEPLKAMSSPSPKPNTFRQWEKADLERSVAENNADGLLSQSETEDFVAYWAEPTPKGKPRLSLEKSWDTRRRMETALRLIYRKNRQDETRSRDRPKSYREQVNDAAVDAFVKGDVW
jgi:hypothetical protein